MRTLSKITFFVFMLSFTCLVNGKPAPRVAFSDNSSATPKLDLPRGSFGVLWGDFNNDKRIDLIYMGHGKGPLMLLQTADHEFEDVTTKSGIKNSDWEYPRQADRHGASCADFDNDGNLDLFISHGAMRGKTLGTKHDDLLQGHGDFSFSEITETAGTQNRFGRGRSSVWFDYDNDGWLDLYVLNFDSNSVMYKNNGDGTFTDVTAKLGLDFPTTGAAPADFDQDGNIDLLVNKPLRLFRNAGADGFVKLEKPEFVFNGTASLGIAWGDADNDGDLDIFFTRASGESRLLVLEDGKFRRAKSDAWVFDNENISTGASWGDMDNDGMLDIVNVRSDGYFIYLNAGELSFTVEKLDIPAPTIKQWGNGDAALGDFNSDGLLDIATDDPSKYRLLQNNSAATNNWLELKFYGTDNNRLGYGNKVWITSKGKLIAYREYTGSAGNLRSTSCNPLHVGLGQNSEVDIRVQWLNGFESVLRGVQANQTVTIPDSDASNDS